MQEPASRSPQSGKGFSFGTGCYLPLNLIDKITKPQVPERLWAFCHPGVQDAGYPKADPPEIRSDATEEIEADSESLLERR